VTKNEQLEWEARFRRPAAFAAFAAGVLLLASLVVRQTIFEDREGIRAAPDALLSVNESPGTLVAGAAIQAVAGLLLVLVFLYLFRATRLRTPTVPNWFLYLVFAGPVLYAIAQLVGAFDQIDLAETFADGSYSFENADSGDGPDLSECPATRGELGEACQEELAQENPNTVSLFVGLIGPVLLAFLFVMLPLRARRAGLLSPFMSILGVLAGVLLVLPLLPPVILQAFWLGAIGALYLGTWPGGRGPAWDTGEPDPWPSPARRRGPAQSDEPEPEAPGGSGNGTEPDPPPQRRSSRKRKRG
jgi:hypothetical protein